jgi:hypothetical protein
MEYWLPLTWAVLIALAVLLYVCMDGFDLGVGILLPAIDEREERDTMVNSIAPFWDGNETWLVLGGGGLLAVFPLAYATILPALYMPIVLMLLALVFRGVAFEMRFRATTQRQRRWWDWSFGGGSWGAALCQGIALGAFVQGIRVEGRGYAGGWWDWLTPFSLLTAAPATGVHGALVRLSDNPVRGTRSAARHLDRLAVDQDAARSRIRDRDPPPGRCSALRARAGAVPAVLCRARDHDVADDRAARHHDLGGRRPAFDAALPSGRGRRADPSHSRLHRLRVLGVPRQGARGRGLPLMRRLHSRDRLHLARESRLGMEAFAADFKPKRQLLVGGDGIALEDFLSRSAESWLA